jgi:hypothetical protein
MKIRITGPIKLEKGINSYAEAEIDVPDENIKGKMMFDLTLIPQSEQNREILKKAEGSENPVIIKSISFGTTSSLESEHEKGERQLSMSITIGNNDE